MRKKHKKVYGVLNYIEHSLILISTVTGCVSISALASLVGIPIGSTSSAIGLKFSVITARLLILISTVTGRLSISAFGSLVGIPIGSSAIGLKACVITGVNKKYKPIIKKKKGIYFYILIKYYHWQNLSSVQVLISKVLIDSNNVHDEFVLINNVPKEFGDMKEEIKKSNDKLKFKLNIKQCYHIV